jgi:hypothetical protein
VWKAGLERRELLPHKAMNRAIIAWGRMENNVSVSISLIFSVWNLDFMLRLHRNIF